LQAFDAEIIRNHQKSSEVIRSHPKSSEIIRSHPESSEIDFLNPPKTQSSNWEPFFFSSRAVASGNDQAGRWGS